MHNVNNKKIALLVVQSMYELDCLGILTLPNNAKFGVYPRPPSSIITDRDRKELATGYNSEKPYFVERNLHVWCDGICCPLEDFDNAVRQNQGRWWFKNIEHTEQIELWFSSQLVNVSPFAFDEDDPLLAS